MKPRHVVALCISLLIPLCHADPVDPKADDDIPYSLPKSSSKEKALPLLSLRSKAIFNSLGGLLNGSREGRRISQSTSQLAGRSASFDDYPPYPGSPLDYGGPLLGGGSFGQYGSGWGNRGGQRVVYIAIPLNALSALLSSSQLSTLGIGSIFPSLPPPGPVAAAISAPPPPPPVSVGGSFFGGGGSSYSSGGGLYNSGVATGAGYVSGLSAGSNYGPSSSGPITYDSGPGLGQVLYGAVSGGGTYGGGGLYSSVGSSYAGGGIGLTGGSLSSYGSGTGWGAGGGYDSGGAFGGLGGVGAVAIPPVPTGISSSLLAGDGTVGSLPCPRGPGFYRHPIDCNRFYRCVDYIPSPVARRFRIYEFNCPAGTVYSVVVWVCVWPYQPEAGSCYAGDSDLGQGIPPIPPIAPFPPPPLLGIRGSAGGYSSSYSANSDYGSGVYGDDDRVIAPKYSKGGLAARIGQDIRGTATTTPKSTSSPNLFQTSDANERPRCLSVGFFSHPLDCTQFAQCWKTEDGDMTGFYFKCPAKTIFNAKVPVCDDPANVPDTSNSCRDIVDAI